MQKVMKKLQKRCKEIKRIQQEISTLKKQLSETREFFRGKERKSLERKIEQAEKSEKYMHTNMTQIAKEAGYSDVQSFSKVYYKSEKLLQEYNEDLKEGKDQMEQKKEKTLVQLKKVSVLEKLHRYQQESRQQPKRLVKKKSMDRER